RAAVARDLRLPEPRHIGVMLDNVPDFVLWIFAAALGGFAVVGINTTRRGESLAQDIRHTDCSALVTSSAGQLGLLRGLDTGIDPARVLVVDSASYADRLAAAAPAPPARGDERDLLML